MNRAIAALLALGLAIVTVAQTQANGRWCQACQGLFTGPPPHARSILTPTTAIYRRHTVNTLRVHQPSHSLFLATETWVVHGSPIQNRNNSSPDSLHFLLVMIPMPRGRWRSRGSLYRQVHIK